MGFETTKTQEQLAAEGAAMCKVLVTRAAGLLLRVCKRRSVHPDIKTHLREVMADLEQVANAVGIPRQ